MEKDRSKNISEIVLQAAQAMAAVAIMMDCKSRAPLFAKQCLTRLENDGILTPQIRKHVLDAFNDYARDIENAIQTINN